MKTTIRTNAAELDEVRGLLSGLLIGGLAGFGAMLLLAPQSGRKTRTRIGQKSLEMQAQATDTLGNLVILTRYDNRKILFGTRAATYTG